MFSKVCLILAIMATVSVRFGHSLSCYTCFEQDTCRNLSQTYCDPTSSEETVRTLDLFYSDVKYINPKYNNEYECIVGRHGSRSNNQPIGDLRGCIAKGAIDCVNYKEELGKELCTLCNTELCNSVATISSSVFITLGLFVLIKQL